MAAKGMLIDYSSTHRRAIRYLPLFEVAYRKHKRPIGKRWRMDESHVKANSACEHVHQAAGKESRTVNLLSTSRRDADAAGRFLENVNS